VTWAFSSGMAEIGLTGTAIGKYNLYLGGDERGQRINRLFRENIDTTTILDTLDPMLERYVAERKAAEGFGDFLVRVGIVDGERTPEVSIRLIQADMPAPSRIISVGVA